MKIVPVTLLKPATKGVITEFASKTDEAVLKGITRLQAIGFVQGREIQFQKHFGRLYLVKMGSDNPFALDKSLADKILVTADDGDIFDSYRASQKANSVVEDLKKLFSRFKRK